MFSIDSRLRNSYPESGVELRLHTFQTLKGNPLK